jgi:steroid 5-alpha reductase family enzyme
LRLFVSFALAPIDSGMLLRELGVALLLAVVLMLLVWVLSLRIHNAGIVDVAWSGCFTLIASLYVVMGDGYLPRRLLMAAMVSVWSLRLTFHLWRRVGKLHPHEDSRYEELRSKWSGNTDRKFFFFFEFQALLNVALSVPFALASINSSAAIRWVEWAGAVLWIACVLGEAIADRQLSRFKSDPANRGKTMKGGLWRYSRHPNYFFEWLIWCSYFLFASGSPWGFATIYCPLLMLHFLLNVTGVPMAEEQSLRSRGDDYRRYQEATSRFFPWFSKESGR